MENEPGQWSKLAGILLMTQSFHVCFNNSQCRVSLLFPEITCDKMVGCLTVWFLVQRWGLCYYMNQTTFKEASASCPWTLFSLLQTKFRCFFTSGCTCSPWRGVFSWLFTRVSLWFVAVIILALIFTASAALPVCGLGFQMFSRFIRDRKNLHLCSSFLL